MRPIAANRKNALFAGGDEAGKTWAIHATLIECCNSRTSSQAPTSPTFSLAWLNGHLQSRLAELTPWAWKPREPRPKGQAPLQRVGKGIAYELSCSPRRPRPAAVGSPSAAHPQSRDARVRIGTNPSHDRNAGRPDRAVTHGQRWRPALCAGTSTGRSRRLARLPSWPIRTRRRPRLGEAADGEPTAGGRGRRR